MTKEDLAAFDPERIDRLISPEEFVCIARLAGAFWSYDYEAAKQGKLGMHAILKSGQHSNGFFISKILFSYANIRWMVARQLMIKFHQLKVPDPYWLAGIPDGATLLGEDVAWILGARPAEMQKRQDGKIEMVSTIGPDEELLFVEDFSTKGTGFREAVAETKRKQSEVKLSPFLMTGLNRGGLQKISVEGVGDFQVVPAFEYRVDDWDLNDCPLCKMGSIPIKPKATEENWQLITRSQL